MKYTIKQLIERLDTEIEMVCCDSARTDWQTLKAAVLAQQTNNSAMVPCPVHHQPNAVDCPWKMTCAILPCLVSARHQ
jgi:hypothetical protein